MAKVKVPKTVAGVKIPKKVRKSANKAIKMAESPAVREIAAVAIGAAGAKRAAGAAKSANGSDRIRDEIQDNVERVAEAFRTAAVAGLRSFMEGLEEGLKDLAERQKSARKPRPTAPRSADAPDA